MNTRELTQRRSALYDEADGILAAPAGDDGALTTAQDAAMTALREKIAGLDKQIEHRQFLDQRDLTGRGTPLNGRTAAGTELRMFSDTQAIKPEAFDGQILRTQNGDHVPVLEARHKLASFLPPSENRASELGLGGFLRALHGGPTTELERRVLAESSIGSGGAFVPTPLSAEVIDALTARMVAFKAGARMIPMSSQTLKFARVTAYPAGSWRAENASITVADPTFDSVTLTAKSWALIVLVSRELLEDGQNVDAQLRNVFATTAGLALDQAILYGTGSSNQPLGVANTSGIQSISLGTNGAQLTAATAYPKLLDAIMATDLANAANPTAIVVSPRTNRAIAALADSTGQPLQPPPRLANVPILATSAMPITETQGSSAVASSALLGDWSTVFVGMRTQLQISILNERYADSGQIGFVLWMRGDVALAHPPAMARVVGIIP